MTSLAVVGLIIYAIIMHWRMNTLEDQLNALQEKINER